LSIPRLAKISRPNATLQMRIGGIQYAQAKRRPLDRLISPTRTLIMEPKRSLLRDRNRAEGGIPQTREDYG
jgi:hypothetical protein